MNGPLREVWCRDCATFRGFWKSGRTWLVRCKHSVLIPREGMDSPPPKCFLHRSALEERGP